MTQNSSKATIAGIVILAGLIGLIFLSLRATGGSLFSHPMRVNAQFANAKGLERGSKVVMAGVPIGQVDSLEYRPEQAAVRVNMVIDEGQTIPADSVASIRLKSLLGTYQVYLEPGSDTSRMLASGQSLQTETFKDMTEILQDLGSIGGGFGDLAQSLNSNQNQLFDRIGRILDENEENLNQTTKSFAEAGPKFDQLMSNLIELSENLNTGDGTLAKLVNDDKIYRDIEEITAELKRFSTDLNTTGSTVALLTQNAEFAAKLQGTVDNVNGAFTEMKSVLTDNRANIDSAIESAARAFPEIERGVNEFVEVGEKINRGEGTLGKLVNDPGLYDAVNDTVQQIRRTFEEGEEQSVMRTFLGVFFGSVI